MNVERIRKVIGKERIFLNLKKILARRVAFKELKSSPFETTWTILHTTIYIISSKHAVTCLCMYQY